LLILISLWDDRRGVPVAIRLLAQIAAAWFWISSVQGPVNVPLLVLLIVWAANLYNFMDGSDGLAGAMTIVGYSAYAVAACLARNSAVSLFFGLVAATVPFLLWNLPPARVFLGDVGAVPLGFMAAVFGIEGWQEQ